VEIIRAGDIKTFAFTGVSSRQLLFPENSKSERVTVTRVVAQPGAKNPPHRHAGSEQVWVALRGAGHLIVEREERIPFAAGDVVRFEDNDLHGFENTGSTEFEYLSVTSPPINFRAAYSGPWAKGAKNDA
jgi:quercetin dioxygenase-like cupin family protein